MSSLKLVSIEELSEQLGISKGTIYYYVSRNEIPFIRIGRHLRFDLEKVISHFERLTEDSKLTCELLANATNRKQFVGSLKTKAEDEAILRGD